MRCLIETDDPLHAQALCDALRGQGIACRIDHAGVHALMPLPGLFDLRVMVAERDEAAARRVLADWETDGGTQP